MTKSEKVKLQVQASTRLTTEEGKALFELAKSLSTFEKPVRPSDILRRALLSFAPFKAFLAKK